MAQEVLVVEAVIDLFLRQVLRDIRVLLDARAEVLAFHPALHSVALYPLVGILAQHALVDNRQQDALAVDQAARAVHVVEHLVRVDEQLVDDVRELLRAVVEVDRRIRQDDALDGRVGDIALMPERDVLESCDGIAAVQAGHAGDALAVDRVALVRHSGRTLLARGEVLLSLADIRALQVADFRRNLLERRGADGDRRDELSVAVALDDLRSEAHRRQAKLLADHLLNLRVDVRVRADSARELADRDDLLGMLHALNVALDLSAPEQELEAERHRLCMDAMRATDARRMLEFLRAAAQDLAELLEVIEDDRAGIAHHHAVCRVLDVRGRQALVDVFGVITNILGDVRQERDDVVVRDRLDLMDAVDIEFCFRANVLGSLFRDLSEFGHGIAGSHLDIQDLLPLVLDRPEMAHFRLSITLDHLVISSSISWRRLCTAEVKTRRKNSN